VLRGTTTAGVEVQVPACVVVKVADGKITRIDEYLDTRQIEPLTTASQ
jgi:ketosteroid isomerase-like protein